MPTVRLLADGQPFLASPAERVEFAPGTILFRARAGDTILLNVDATAWIGYGDTIASAAWAGELTAASPTVTGSVASAKFALPSAGRFYLTSIITSTAGRITYVSMQLDVI